jgi:CRP-like cAMP-binding protein
MLNMTPEQTPMFDVKGFLAKVGEGRTLRSYEKGQRIFSQDDAADSVFYIQKGKVKVTVTSRQGKEAVVAILGAGDFFGEGCLASQMRRISTATSMVECSVMRFRKEVIAPVLQHEPAFTGLFLRYVLSRNIRIEEDLVDQLFNSSEKRLARALLLLANFGKEGAPDPVIPKINHQTLAEIVGTTRPRISFFMKRFRTLGFIEYSKNGVEIRSSLLNIVLHD